MSTPPSILYCHCAFAQVVPAETRTAVLEALSASGVSFDAVPDLCEMAARRDPAVAGIAAAGSGTIVACYPRAVRWLFNSAGAALGDDVQILNMREAEAPAIAAALGIAAAEQTS